LAIANGHLQLALRLVEWGADPNDQRSGISPLHAVALLRKPDRGEDVEPPVQVSGNLSSLDFVRALVAKGADVNLKIVNGKSAGKAKLNSDGASPLLYAAKTADTALLKVLVELGADIHCQNADGCTPLLAAAGVGVTAVDEEAGTESEVVEAIEYLLSKGASIQAVTAKKDSAMHGAAFRAYPAVIQLLHQRGLKSEDWNHKDSFGWSPFDIADGKRPGSVKPNPSVRQALENALRSFENQ
jgi:ankyrin repeat protein